VIVLDQEEITFQPGETIHTENSYKYDEQSFLVLAEDAGWEQIQVWKDPGALFSVRYLERKG